MYPALPVDRARKYFLLVLCEQDEPEVARGYLKEKVNMLWACDTVQGIYGRLDTQRQKQFDDLAWADGFRK